MPVITAKTSLAAGATSAWSTTDSKTNIVVGVEGNKYDVEYNLGSTLVYSVRPSDEGNPQSIVVAKANEVRVVNNGSSALNYEVYS